MLQIMGVVDLKHTQEHELTLEWDSSSANDMIADSTLALITSVDKSPASVKRISAVPICRLLLTVNSNV